MDCVRVGRLQTCGQCDLLVIEGHEAIEVVGEKEEERLKCNGSKVAARWHGHE